MFQLSWKNEAMARAEPPITPLPLDEPTDVLQAAFLMWEEHCAECSPPQCYASCSLYVRRADQKCARFVYGIVPNRQFHGAENFGAEVKFRRWAKLETRWPTSPRAYSLAQLRRISALLNGLEGTASLIASAAEPLNPERRINGALTHYLGKYFHTFAESRATGAKLDGFLAEFFCPDDVCDAFTFEIIEAGKPRFRTRLPINRGWNRHFVDARQLPGSLNGDAKASLLVASDREVRVVFTWLHLVKLVNAKVAPVAGLRDAEPTAPRRKPADKVKCVILDLDNTLWEGVIGDDGLSGVSVKQEVVDFIHEMDRRGIICSVASKNDFELAWRKIEEIGLDQHLLFAQINWGPKSDSVKRIASAMNVAPDTFAFIDDNAFERREVSARCPEVRTFDVGEIGSLLGRPEFDVPITEQSGKRRHSYLAESRRTQARESTTQDIDDFLRSCGMSMQLMPAAEHFERCHELVCRTNQFNISGKKYPAADFRKLLESEICVCWRVEDRFGDYGIVGFARIEEGAASYLMTDFVMSCRVAEKRVEESLFAFLARHLPESKPLRFRFVRTDRNGPIQQKFVDMDLTIVSEADGVRTYELVGSADAVDPRVMHVSGEIMGASCLATASGDN